MTRTYLVPHAFLATREEDLLILDSRAGDYLCLPGVAAGVDLAAGTNAVTLSDPDLAEALASLGLIDPELGVRPRPNLPPPPTVDLDPAPCGVSAAQILRMSAAGLDMLRGHWRAPFARLAVAERTARAGRPDLTDAAAQARAFHTLMPWVPFQGECLFRSLMLRAFLRRAGLTATWVVGCQTWPFEAHCWLQLDDTVLDDTVDHAAGFTPILAI